MSRSLAEWRYTGSVDENRQAALCRFQSFEELVACAAKEVKVLRAITEPGRDSGLTDALQPVFFLELSETGNPLFNGPHGYRAQYWSSPWRGLEANAFLIESLQSKLMASIDVAQDPRLTDIDVAASLGAVSAKFWVREAPSTVGGSHDLEVDPWASRASAGVELAILGVAAPRSSKYEIKGALVDSFGNERVPSRKLRRHHDIHLYGFS